MKHLRLDWQGIQDLRAHILPELEAIHLMFEHRERGARDRLERLLEATKLAAGFDAFRRLPVRLDRADIAPDEPVFVLRARDVVDTEAMRAWVAHAEEVGLAPALVARADAWATEMETYAATRAAHGDDTRPRSLADADLADLRRAA